MKTIIHINQHIIKSNKKENKRDHPITVKDYINNRKGSIVEIVVENKVVATILYKPDNPLNCGATCWVETNEKVNIK